MTEKYLVTLLRTDDFPLEMFNLRYRVKLW